MSNPTPRPGALRALPYVFVTLAVASSGCTKQKECNAFIEGVNKYVGEVAKYDVKDSDDDKTKLDKLGQMAGLFENASKTVSGLKLTTTELKKFATDYVTMADSLAKNARALAGATKEILGMASSPGGLEAASEEFGKVCEVAANMGDCAPIAEKMAAFPQDEEPATAGPKIVAFAKEFEALTAKKQPVKDVLEKLKVEINKHGVTMTRLAELVKKSEDAQKEMEGLVKQEDTIVDALNGFCGGK